MFCNFAMKVVSSIKTLKNRHPDCKVVRRKGRFMLSIKQTHASKPVRDNLVMRKDIHPKLNPTCFVDVSSGKKFITQSVATSDKTENIDGVDHQLFIVM